MANIFDSVKINRVKSSTFDLSHDVKLSFNMGELVPILCMETLPGDRFTISNETLIRFQPMVAPVMHRMDVFVHYFFVPHRILWSNWENFITQTKIGSPAALPVVPTVTIGPSDYTKVLDYFGIPEPPLATTTTISALPFAAYQKIYYEYYRDQNLVPATTAYDLVDGTNNAQLITLAQMRKRAWEKDYFTSALPFAQKGDAVAIPGGTVSLDTDVWAPGTTTFPRFYQDTGVQASTGNVRADGVPGSPYIDTSALPGDALAYDPNGTLKVDGGTMEELRQANALQRFLEKMARGGSRYVEYTKSIFNVRSSDQRMQRPEYITGTKNAVVISEVLNTTGTTDAAQGTMAGHGIAVGQSNNGSYFCEEHGYIIGIMSVLPKTAYMQGIPKHFLKTDAFDYGTPDFANLGEQPIQNQEIYAYQGAADTDTFGYTPRYAEYKFEQNRVAGDFRTSLDFWHLARKFATPPALNAAFVEMDSEAADRIFAVTDPDEEKLLAQVFNKVRAVRPLPKFGTPTF